MEESFHIAEIDAMTAEQAHDLFRRCLAVDRWAGAMAAGRPYADPAALLTRADELSASLSDEEVRQALDDHPRIGARTTAGSMSATEQSAVYRDISPPDPPQATLADRLLAANRAYEQRFGHIYLVAAAGRDGEDLLADCAARMANDPATELAVVRRELGKIARSRLERIVGR